MSLFVDVGFKLLNSNGDGSIAALFLKTFEASKDTLGQKELLFLDMFLSFLMTTETGSAMPIA